MKLGLSLAGGGIKGFSHIGAIKALEEAKIKFDYISGTSSGSIVATLYACSYTTDEIYKIFQKYVNEIKYVDSVNIKKFFRNLITFKGIQLDGLNSGTKIKKLVEKVCSQKGITNINQVRMPLVIPAVNLKTEELYVFSNNILENRSSSIKYINNIDLGTAVQASCSYPGVFSPCRYKQDLLVDGGIAENIPWRETKRAGADKVISIVFTDKVPKKCCDNIFEVINKSFSILSKELAEYEWDGADYLLKIKEPKVGLLEKKKIDELYNEGYIQTKQKIGDIRQKLGI